MKASFQITKLDYWVYGISIALCFLLFKQSDLSHTNASSFAYLYGHFGDFYDYNQPRFVGNNYLPLIYWIFAIWNIPLKLMGLLSEVTGQTWMLSTPIQTVWSKLLIAAIFFSTVRILRLISEEIGSMTRPEQPWLKSTGTSSFLFSTSPFAVFAVFIFSGYDIFSVFFMLLGLLAYFRKSFKWFAFWFSVAISFKYFAVLAYLPLVLLVEKKYYKLLIYGVAGVSVSLFQFALYWHSSAFHEGIFGMIANKTVGNGLSPRFYIANLVYCTMCIYLFFSKMNFNVNPKDWCQRAVFSCILSYALFFSWTQWHPQWIILIIPFVCLSHLFISREKILLCTEILGYLGFAIYCINNWHGIVDNAMVYGGIFREIFPPEAFEAREILGHRWMAASRTFFYLFLYSPLIIFVLEHVKALKIYQTEKDKTSISPQLDPIMYSNLNLLKLRFMVGPYFFIFVTLACVLVG
jgi:hypothetical protein